MTALAKNGDFQRRGPITIRPYPAGAGAHPFKASIVVVDTTTGYAEAGTDAANKKCVGVATKECNNAAGAAAALEVEAAVGVFRFACSSLEQADVGKLVYILDDATVTDGTAASNDIPVGTLVELESASFCYVSVLEGVAGLAST